VLRLEIVKRNDDPKGFVVPASSCRAAGSSRELSLGLAAIAASPRNYENLTGTLAAFVASACIPIAVRRLAR
jgi:hypothetical protein